MRRREWWAQVGHAKDGKGGCSIVLHPARDLLARGIAPRRAKDGDRALAEFAKTAIDHGRAATSRGEVARDEETFGRCNWSDRRRDGGRHYPIASGRFLVRDDVATGRAPQLACAVVDLSRRRRDATDFAGQKIEIGFEPIS